MVLPFNIVFEPLFLLDWLLKIEKMVTSVNDITIFSLTSV